MTISRPAGGVGVRRWKLPRQRPGDRLVADAGHPPLPRSVWVVAAIVTAVELAVAGRYGLHRDELYFIVAGSHPAFGYVDQPPLAPLLAHTAWSLWHSPVAVRILPAVCAGAIAVTAALLARELGGRRPAMLLAAIATGCAPVLLAAGHLGGTTIYDELAWSVATLLTIRAVRSGDRRYWLAAGLVVGVGLWNKELLVTWAAAVTIGLLATGRHRVLARPGPWLGTLVAAALAIPLLIWQVDHGWPVLTMSHRLRVEHSAGGDYTSVLPAYAVYAGVLAFPLAVIGIVRLMRTAADRWLAVAVLVTALYVAATIPGRPYYVDGFLPLAFAAGGVAVEQRRTGRPRRTWFVVPVVGAIVSLPLVLPVLPVSSLHDIPGLHKLNYDAGETVGWPQFTAAVERVYRQLPAPQRAGAAVFTANYGEAGALTVYGSHQLPPVLSGHNGFAYWGPGRAPDHTVIAVGTGAQLAPYFARCRNAATFHSPYQVDNDENGVDISICSGPRASWSTLWSRLRHLD